MKYLLIIVALGAAVVGAWLMVPEDRRDALLQRPGEVAEGFPSGEEDAVGGREQEVSGQVYQWRDEHGRTHYGDAPPPGVEAEPVEKGEISPLPDQPDSESSQP